MKITMLFAFFCFMLISSIFGQTDRGILVNNNQYKKTKEMLALIIGNDNYPENKKLLNPKNDADSISKYLKKLKFDVLEYNDLDINKTKEAIADYIKRLKEYKIGLFFFAGHGSERNGENFLYPIDANPKTAIEMERDCIRLNQLLNDMAASQTDANLVILDACRTNPFRDWSSNSNNEQQKGLAKVDAPKGTLICFASSPGYPAADGLGNNGVYTQCLIKNISKENVSVFDMLTLVNSDVREITKGKQIPFMASSLNNVLYLNYKPGANPVKKEQNFDLETLNGSSYEQSTSTDVLTFMTLPGKKLDFSGDIAEYRVAGKLKQLKNRTFQVVEGNVTGNLTFSEDYELIKGSFTIKESKLIGTFNLEKKE